MHIQLHLQLALPLVIAKELLLAKEIKIQVPIHVMGCEYLWLYFISKTDYFSFFAPCVKNKHQVGGDQLSNKYIPLLLNAFDYNTD